MKKLIYILSAAIFILGCVAPNIENIVSDGGQGSVVTNNDSEFNLLFIGNSLTYSNNLPELVEAFALTQGKNISVTTIAKGNYALIDHWGEGVIQTRIETGNYDFVIVQQGPSSQPYGRGLLIEYGGLETIKTYLPLYLNHK